MMSGEQVHLSSSSTLPQPPTYRARNFKAAEAAGHSIGLAGSDDLWTGTENQLLN